MTELEVVGADAMQISEPLALYHISPKGDRILLMKLQIGPTALKDKETVIVWRVSISGKIQSPSAVH